MPPNRKKLQPEKNPKKIDQWGMEVVKKWASSKNRIIISKSKMTKLKTVK
jgi:hypothetical protein